jgi:hypothetical protein
MINQIERMFVIAAIVSAVLGGFVGYSLAPGVVPASLVEVTSCGTRVGYVMVTDTGEVRSLDVLGGAVQKAARVLHDRGTMEFGKIAFACKGESL